MGRKKSCQYLRTLATILFIFILPLGLLTTNLSPIWIQAIFYIAGAFFLGLTVIYLIVCVAIPWWQDDVGLENQSAIC